MRNARTQWSVVAALALIFALAVPQLTGAATQPELMMRLQGTLTSSWSIPAYAHYNDGCYVESYTGSGSERLRFSTGQAGVGMNPLFNNHTYQIAIPDGVTWPSAHHVMPGFGTADVVRHGSEGNVWTKASSWTSSCYPQRPDQLLDASGCGEKRVPWGAEPYDRLGSIHPEPAIFLIQPRCPYHGPLLPDRDASVFPEVARAHLSFSKLAQLIASKHGRLSVSGHHTWNTTEVMQGLRVNATCTVHWTLSLVQVHPAAR
jgi:hypothetical protein